MITSISKWGNSQGVRLPKTLLESLDFAENSTVEIIAGEDSIIIKKFYKNEDEMLISKLFSDYEGQYQAVDMSWGVPAGKEIW